LGVARKIHPGPKYDDTARLKEMLDAMPDCVKIFGKSGALVHINPKGLELLQAPNLAALSTPGYAPVSADQMPEVLNVHTRVMNGESVVWTYAVTGLLGRSLHVEAHSAPFEMPDGSRVHLSITRDINQREQAHEAVRRSEERLRLVHEATGLADFETDSNGVSTCSDRFFAQCGLPPTPDAKVNFDEWIEIVHADDRERLRAEVLKALADQDAFGCQFRIIRRDTREVRWISARTRVERDAHGQVVRTIGAHLDITDLKRAEEALRASEERLRLVQGVTGLADFEAGPDGVARFSDQFARQAGLPPGTTELPLVKWLCFVHPDDRAGLQQKIEQSLVSAHSFDHEFRIVRADTGEVRWISSRTKMDRDENGQVIRSIGAHLDVTQRKQAEEALRESEERFRLAAEAAGLGVWDYDLELERGDWSDLLRAIFGIPAEAAASVATAEACVHPADRELFKRTLQDAKTSETARFEATLRIRRANDAAVRWITMNGWRTFRADSPWRRVIVTVRDVTEEKTAEERVRWSASHDALTRLANRGLFQERLDAAVHKAAESGRAVGLLLLDMDHFKQINDSLGHDAGDMLLKTFAERLKGVVRDADTVARFGGDEFAVILPELDGEHTLLAVGRAIQEQLREPFVHAGRILDCRVSIGACIFPEHGKTPEVLLKNADIALYATKAAGRGAVTVFEPHMRENVHRRGSMIQLARAAISDDRIIPYYQPKLDIGTRSLVGFEALLRWRMPNGRIGHPAAVEAAFEDSEVAAQISDRMIERVIADVRYWLDRGIDFKNVAVNASAAEFRRDNFAERVLEQLARADIPTRCFQLEVTETVFLGRGAEYVHRALALLNMRGVKIALDDFGTGYASLRHLKQFPVDTIKIDQSFVRDMAEDPNDEAIIRAVINLGSSLGIKVVAEGIENDAQANRLLALDCDFGQGFLFSRAVPASRVPALVDRWSTPRRVIRRQPNLRLVAPSAG
jgi:diguanylate cyclase (GGDEF)-like protein/PAS domain S-box-containing protein